MHMATKKAAAKKTTSGRPPVKKAPATKAPARKSGSRSAAAGKAPAKKTTKKTTKKAPAPKAAAKAPAKVAPRAGAKKSAAPKPAQKAAPKAASKAAAKRRTVRRGGITVPPVVSATGEDYPFDYEFLSEQRRFLLAERARYVGHAERFEAEADALARDREPGDVQFDDESGEGDSIAVERERDLALSAQARQAVEEIDAALARMKEGTYGLSLVSGLPIPKERLEAIPEASLRVEEKSAGPWR
jgi:RNA polymerase-binding transcription factor DksA